MSHTYNCVMKKYLKSLNKIDNFCANLCYKLLKIGLLPHETILYTHSLCIIIIYIFLSFYFPFELTMFLQYFKITI